MNVKQLWLASAIAGSIALSGCIDLGEKDDDEDRPSGSLTGKAADGYLGNANVCLDTNRNKVCDRGEPSATTGPNGDFTINADESQITSAPIVVEIIVGTTIDQDNPGVPLTKAYSLTAPAGYSFVSPITTLVQAKVEELGSLEEAEDTMQSLIGTSIDFDEDYIAGQSDALSSDEAQAAFEQLHQIAQVVATILGNNMDANNIEQDSDNFGDVLDLVVTKVEVALGDIVAAVENNTGTFDPAAIAASDDIANATEVDPQTLEEELALQEDLDNATKADFQTLLGASQGMHWLEYDYEDDNGNADIEIGYGVVTFDGTTTVNKFFAWNGTAFSEVTDTQGGDGGDPMDCGPNQNEPCDEEKLELVLSASGWTQAEEPDDEEDGPIFSSFDSDGAVIMDQGIFTVKLEGEEFSLTGNNIQGSLFGTGDWEWAESISNTSTFGDGAKGYKIKMATASDVYILPEFEEECEEESGVNNIVGDCNLLEFFESGAQEPDYKTSSFNPIVTTRGSGSDPSAYTALALDGGEGFALLAEFGPDNTIFYYEVTLQNDEVTSFTKVLEAPYEQRTVHGKSLIVFKVPFQLVPDFFEDDHHDQMQAGDTQGSGDMHHDDRHEDRGPRPASIFLTAHEGYWRFGGLLKAGTPIPDDAPFVYNKTAMDNIKSAFGSGENLFEPAAPANTQTAP